MNKYPDPRCDCESIECDGHEAGSCHGVGSYRVEMFGMKTRLCAVCLGVAQAFLEDEVKIISEAKA